MTGAFFQVDNCGTLMATCPKNSSFKGNSLLPALEGYNLTGLVGCHFGEDTHMLALGLDVILHGAEVIKL